MSKLHEILAAEKSVKDTWETLQRDTLSKLGKPDAYFRGETSTLKMLEDNPANATLEESARTNKELVTTIHATLAYAFAAFARSETLQAQKNLTNAVARATVVFRGQDLLKDMPIDSLLGLESRLKGLREIVLAVPTLDASIVWSYDAQSNCFRSPETYTTRTEKRVYGIILHPGNDKHPPQVDKATDDRVVGKFTRTLRSGCATAAQKAEAILLIDELSVEVKKARQRANDTALVASPDVGTIIAGLVLTCFSNKV
jgi:hypothetical protein